MVVRASRALEAFGESRQSPPAVFALGLAVYAAVSIVLPVAAGRDLARYLLVYAQLFDAHIVYPNALLARTPGTPIVVGLLLDAGPIVSEIGAAALYAGSIVAWFCVARRFGPVTAWTTALALLVYPGYVLLFHQLAQIDSVHRRDGIDEFLFVCRLIELVRARHQHDLAPQRQREAQSLHATLAAQADLPAYLDAQGGLIVGRDEAGHLVLDHAALLPAVARGVEEQLRNERVEEQRLQRLSRQRARERGRRFGLLSLADVMGPA